MSRSRLINVLALTGFILCCCFASASSAAGTDQAVAVAVDDFNYLDTSGEVTDQVAAHQRRLQAFMDTFRRDFTTDKHFHLASPCTTACSANGSTPDDRVRAAPVAGATILIVGGIQKTSTLVQWARAAAVDIPSNSVVYEKVFTFRGDNDEAWERVEAFMSQDIRSALAHSRPALAPAAAQSIGLAVFEFELEDTSAGATYTGDTTSDTTALADTTDAVRRLLTQSGRYRVTDIGAARADAAAKHNLHECDGCDASIAQELGADQSLVGVIRRVSRTEYTVRFRIRQARTGAVVFSGESGLRMGANYSWKRGAVGLIRDRLLESGAQQ